MHSIYDLYIRIAATRFHAASLSDTLPATSVIPYIQATIGVVVVFTKLEFKPDECFVKSPQAATVLLSVNTLIEHI